jgi:hypothetical protein
LKVYKGLLLDQLVWSFGYNDHVVASQGPEKQELPLLQKNVNNKYFGRLCEARGVEITK